MTRKSESRSQQKAICNDEPVHGDLEKPIICKYFELRTVLIYSLSHGGLKTGGTRFHLQQRLYMVPFGAKIKLYFGWLGVVVGLGSPTLVVQTLQGP